MSEKALSTSYAWTPNTRRYAASLLPPGTVRTLPVKVFTVATPFRVTPSSTPRSGGSKSGLRSTVSPLETLRSAYSAVNSAWPSPQTRTTSPVGPSTSAAISATPHHVIVTVTVRTQLPVDFVPRAADVLWLKRSAATVLPDTTVGVPTSRPHSFHAKL